MTCPVPGARRLSVAIALRFSGLILYSPVTVRWLGILVGTACSAVRTHREFALENLARRQQLAVFKVRQPRPPLRATDRILWVVLSRLRKNWRRSLHLG